MDFNEEEFLNVLQAMSEEEKKTAAKLIPIDILWDTLREKELEERNTVERIKAAL